MSQSPARGVENMEERQMMMQSQRVMRQTVLEGVNIAKEKVLKGRLKVEKA